MGHGSLAWYRIYLPGASGGAGIGYPGKKAPSCCIDRPKVKPATHGRHLFPHPPPLSATSSNRLFRPAGPAPGPVVRHAAGGMEPLPHAAAMPCFPPIPPARSTVPRWHRGRLPASAPHSEGPIVTVAAHCPSMRGSALQRDLGPGQHRSSGPRESAHHPVSPLSPAANPPVPTWPLSRKRRPPSIFPFQSLRTRLAAAKPPSRKRQCARSGTSHPQGAPSSPGEAVFHHFHGAAGGVGMWANRAIRLGCTAHRAFWSGPPLSVMWETAPFAEDVILFRPVSPAKRTVP